MSSSDESGASDIEDEKHTKEASNVATDVLREKLDLESIQNKVRETKSLLLSKIRDRALKKSIVLSTKKRSFDPSSIPVARSVGKASRIGHKGKLLQQLRSTALKQGAEETARALGYSSYQEQLRHTAPDLKPEIPQPEPIPPVVVEEMVVEETEKVEEIEKVENEIENEIEVNNEVSVEEEHVEPKKSGGEKAKVYRAMLEAEEKRARVKNRSSTGFLDEEAEEEQEEEALRIKGLGEYGFTLPNKKSSEMNENGEKEVIEKIREEDMEGIVDDLSDEEKDESKEEMLFDSIRQQEELKDKETTREMMRKVRDGFGRNRKAFSSSTGTARGRFDLDQLVAPDGSKKEAARLGILASDEELSEDEDGEKQEDEEEEEDEEAMMERMLIERHTRQPQVYLSSSDDESEEEIEPEENEKKESDDEERELQQMKQFSARAKLNRRLQRMQAMASTTTTTSQVLEQSSQELLKCLKRTDVSRQDQDLGGFTLPQKQPELNKAYSLTALSTSASFERAAESFKISHSTASTTRGFVFTTTKEQEGEGEQEDEGEKEKVPAASRRKETRKSFASQLEQPKKKKSKVESSFFQALAQYRCSKV